MLSSHRLSLNAPSLTTYSPMAVFEDDEAAPGAITDEPRRTSFSWQSNVVACLEYHCMTLINSPSRHNSYSPLHDSDYITFLNFSPLSVLNMSLQVIGELFEEPIACL